MSEITIALIGGGAGIGGVFLGWYLGSRSERKNRQLEMIMEIYRPLIENLRTSIKQCLNDFKTAMGNVDRSFDLLRKYFTDGTMKAIEGYDSDLYNELVKIRNEDLDSLDKIERSRMESLKAVRRVWIEILKKKDTNMNIEQFVDSLMSSIIWSIWRGDDTIAKQAYEERLSNLIKQVSTIKPPPESTFQELLDSANKEMDKVKSVFPMMVERFKEIEKNVISRMEKTIKDQF